MGLILACLMKIWAEIIECHGLKALRWAVLPSYEKPHLHCVRPAILCVRTVGDKCGDEEIGIGTNWMKEKFKTVKKWPGLGDWVDVSGDILCIDPNAAVKTVAGETTHQLENSGGLLGGATDAAKNRNRRIDEASGY
ncbi:hypothetical protein J5J83_08180 [Azoarcus sp. L1K30]|uniref:hypothetical protein n=1 Tax=Azoarcus sp. L1K30 TaxID=2820277 RepID=UPI001B837F58|nr:hypothetical protein [Azoarcus sp. L1K30]MBR0566091.1 hypothetical protein [Azoarcus sp. L1K30]